MRVISNVPLVALEVFANAQVVGNTVALSNMGVTGSDNPQLCWLYLPRQYQDEATAQLGRAALRQKEEIEAHGPLGGSLSVVK